MCKIEHDDIDNTDLIICHYVQKVLSLNSLEEYFEVDEVGKLKWEPLENQPRKQPRPIIAPPNKKSDGGVMAGKGNHGRKLGRRYTQNQQKQQKPLENE